MVVADVPPSGAAPGGPGGPGGPAHENDASRTSAAQRLRDTNSQALASSRMLTSPAGRTPPLRTPTRDVRHARTERVRRHRERLLALGPLSRDFAACIVVRARRLLHELAGLNQENRSCVPPRNCCCWDSFAPLGRAARPTRKPRGPGKRSARRATEPTERVKPTRARS